MRWQDNGSAVCTVVNNAGYVPKLDAVFTPGTGAVIGWLNYRGWDSAKLFVEHVNRDGLINGSGSTVCNGGGSILPANVAGTNYQWQVDIGDGAGFLNVPVSAHYTNANSSNLNLINIPGNWYGYRYRCIIDGSRISIVYTLKIINTWTGQVNNDWFSSGNWSCGIIPDEYTDVLIFTGDSVMVNAPGAICRTINLSPSSNLVINQPYTLTVTH